MLIDTVQNTCSCPLTISSSGCITVALTTLSWVYMSKKWCSRPNDTSLACSEIIQEIPKQTSATIIYPLKSFDMTAFICPTCHCITEQNKNAITFFFRCLCCSWKGTVNRLSKISWHHEANIKQDRSFVNAETVTESRSIDAPTVNGGQQKSHSISLDSEVSDITVLTVKVFIFLVK